MHKRVSYIRATTVMLQKHLNMINVSIYKIGSFILALRHVLKVEKQTVCDNTCNKLQYVVTCHRQLNTPLII